MNSLSNVIVSGFNQRPFLLDAYWPENGESPFPTVVFIHGYKGFKDWGHWSLIGQHFVDAGFAFVKFNFSHNGTTLDTPTEFSDLEAFGNNSYRAELHDVNAVLQWIKQQADTARLPFDASRLQLIGHSRGGPIALITAANNQDVQAVATWASVDGLDYAWRDKLDEVAIWKKEGVRFVLNGRTGQQMPNYYQLYEDFEANRSTYDVEQLSNSLQKPCFIVHGKADPAISEQHAAHLHSLLNHSELLLIDDADHVFGGSHPFTEEQLPTHSQIAVDRTIDFFKQL